MIPVHAFRGQHVALFGLARSGLAAGRALMAGGAIVHAWDDGEAARERAEDEGLTLDDLYEADWSAFAALVLSPGVPLTHPGPHALVKKAREHDVEIIGDVELFAREMRTLSGTPAAPTLIAVTGTNGKSTTTALIVHILNCCGYTAWAGGNIGKAVLDLAPPNRRTVYVIEMSSYQIDLTRSLRPDVAVLLNIAPDHLERHGSMDSYVAVKARIFEGQAPDQISVIGVDDSYTQEICTRISARNGRNVVPVSVGQALGRGIYAIGGILYDGASHPSKKIVDLKEAAALPGRHNWQNAAAAFAATRHLVKDHLKLADALVTFSGLAHRLEDLGTIGRVRFINDSKATNADAAARALETFRNIYWIAGGRAKEGGIESLRPLFKNVTKAYLIGEAVEAFAPVLQDQIPFERAGELDQAVRMAHDDAQRSCEEEPVVMLAPACASFDQYPDFEARGDAFRTLVRELMKERASAPAADGESAA